MANPGDLNNDNIDEVVIATQTPPRLVVLNGVNGGILFDYSFGAGINQRGDRAEVLDDIDTNGINEFLGGNREGRVICFYGGNGVISSVDPVSSVPSDFTLYQNHPNPFNPSTVIRFSLPENSDVSLKVFDMLGREVSTIVSSPLSAGIHEFSFEGDNIAGGVYFYTLQAGDFRQTKKMLLVK